MLKKCEEGFLEWEKISEGPWTKRRKHQVVVWENRILLMGGFDGESAFDLNDVWSWGENILLTDNQIDRRGRVDENTWRLVCNSAGWSGRDGHCAVVLRDQIFVLGGTDDPFLCKCDVWSSYDGGVTWNCLLEVSPWPERWQHAACVHTHKNVSRIYITGGWGECYLNDVWSSTDGVTWIKVCAAAPWRPRMFHSVVSFKDSLYIIGGHDGHTQLNDVWASADGGYSWIQVCQNAQWHCRQGHTTVVLDNNLYLIGGFGGSSRFNDMWKSSDAAHWVSVPCGATWSARQGHAAAAFDGCVFVFGGFDESGYCNTAFRLRISTSSRADSQSLKRKTSEGKPQSSEDIYRPQKTLTVSITCVMNTIRTLQKKRSRHDYLVQALINSLALVMSAVRPSIPEAVSGKAVPSQSDWQIGSGDLRITTDTSHPSDKMSLSLKLDNCGIDSSVASGNMGKVGSPFRENFLESRHATSLNSYSAMLKRDFQSQLFDVSAALSPSNNRRSLGKANSNRGKTHDEGLLLTTGKESRLQSVDSVDGIGIEILSHCSNNSGVADKVADSGDEESLSSALLHGNMEKYRRDLSKLQHQIRFNAEQDKTTEMNTAIAERNLLASQAFKEAVLLHEHLEAVLKMHDNKNSHVMKMLSSTEEMRLHQLQSYRQAFHGNYNDGNIGNNLSIIKTDSAANSESQNSISDDENIFCSWQSWRETMSKCVEMIHSLDSSVCNASVDALLQVMDSISRLSSSSALWLAKRSSVSQPESGSSSVEISKQSQCDNDSARKDEPQDLLLGEEYEAALESQDRCKLTAKIHADEEIALIDKLEADMITTLELACKNGSGLLNSVLHQNNLNIIEVKNMQSEVKSWLDRVGYLKDAEQLEVQCVKLINENQGLEEELLQLENERIDVKSAYEKAALNAHSSRHSLLAKHSYYRHNSGQDEEISSATKVKDQSLITIELNNLREKWNKVENDVRRKRRAFRNWYRDNKNFAMECCPELFHYLPDFRTPGSILGDGGFADMAKVPRRKLDDYDDISPLVPSSASSPMDWKQRQALTSGRHILLKASLDGENVVLKGFVMNNFAQRKGFERELHVLSKLKNDSIICPGAIVEGSGSGSQGDGGNGLGDPSLQATIFIQYPFCAGGNLSQWLKAEARKPWELQAIARQILYALLYLHDNGVIHKDIKPSNILLHEDGRIVLADFELAKEMRRRSINSGERSLVDGAEEVSTKGFVDEDEDITASVSVSGTRGFMAPEIESGGQAAYASDMYSFGVVLATMHFPAALDRWVPGQPLAMAMTMPLSPGMPRRGESNTGTGAVGGDADLIQLVHKLLSVDSKERPTAASCVVHPYFRASYMDRLEREGELVAQDRKLEAVRHLLKKTHFTFRNTFDKVTVRRSHVCEDTLEYFLQLGRLQQMDKIKSHLKVTFENEPGVDQGGLLTELFSMYFEDIFLESNPCGLFETQAASSFDGEQRHGSAGNAYTTVLPSAQDALPERMQRLHAVGASIVKALYEGKRIGSRLCPFVFKFIASANPSPTLRDLQYFDPQTAKSLQWMLVTSGVEQFGLHFESVGQPDLGPVSDANKVQFVGMKIEKILMHNRSQQLSALKKGFVDALTALSEEAAPFLSLLSHTDWRVMLCGDSSVNAHQIVSSLSFSDFPKKSAVPQWLQELLLTLSDDALRKFLVFVTGSPSFPVSFASSEVRVNVRCLPRSMSLPVAHTCFFHLDMPDYKDKETLQNKLLYAIQNANTYEIV